MRNAASAGMVLLAVRFEDAVSDCLRPSRETLRSDGSLCTRFHGGCNRLGSMVDAKLETESTELTTSRTTDSKTPPTKRGGITSKRSMESTSNETQTGEAGKPVSSERGDPVSFNVIMETALFRSTSSFLSTAVTDESVVVCLEVWKRMERCLLARPPSETYVASTDCPWSTRMMIKLNAMPYRRGGRGIFVSGYRSQNRSAVLTYDYLDDLKEKEPSSVYLESGRKGKEKAHAVGDAVLSIIRREVHGEEDNDPD